MGFGPHNPTFLILNNQPPLLIPFPDKGNGPGIRSSQLNRSGHDLSKKHRKFGILDEELFYFRKYPDLEMLHSHIAYPLTQRTSMAGQELEFRFRVMVGSLGKIVHHAGYFTIFAFHGDHE